MHEDSENWEITPAAQPKPADYDYDLDAALSAVVELEAEVPADAFTAQTLGEARAGAGVVIDDAGLVLTIGYLVTEAQQVRLSAGGRTVDGHVLGIDAASGFGLVQALDPLNASALPLGDSRHATAGEPVVVAGPGGRRRAVAARIMARQEFAGYWEYLIDEAIFTAPAHPNWGGAAVIGPDGKLLGVGSLQLHHQSPGGRVLPLNMVVPVELLTPILDDLKAGRVTRRRPWLGVYAEDDGEQVILAGVAAEGPAKRAGLKPGDVVKAAAGMELTNLADFYRSLWALGPPGVSAPLTIQRGDAVFDLTVKLADRNAFLRKPRLN